MPLAREFHLGKNPIPYKYRQPQRPGALGTHLGAGGVSLAVAAVVAVAGARQGVWSCTQDGTQLGGRGRVPAPSPVTRQLPPDTFRPLLCECVCQALSLLVSSGPQPLPTGPHATVTSFPVSWLPTSSTLADPLRHHFAPQVQRPECHPQGLCSVAL